MSNWTILLTIIAVTNGQPNLSSILKKNEAEPKLWDTHQMTHKSNTVIENKNVNIMVNVDPKAIARELWKVIEAHLNLKPNRRSFDSQITMRELEGIVESIVSPSRRGAYGPSPFEIAHQLEHVARSAISKDPVGENSIDTEILSRTIVSEMLQGLKGIKEAEKTFDEEKSSLDDPNDENRRGIYVSRNKNEYVDLKMRILKDDFVNAIETSMDKSGTNY